MKNINIINGDTFLEGLKSINCGDKHIFQISKKDFEIKQETTIPLEGYESPIGFPNCCESHKQFFQIGLNRFNNFPNCCNDHKNLNHAKWFKKENYSYLPEKFVTTIAYTRHCILLNIQNQNWYKIITDYIEYTKASYGQFPEGYGTPIGVELYLLNIEKQIESEQEIPDEKKLKLISFVKKYFKPVKKIEQTDLNLLMRLFSILTKRPPRVLGTLSCKTKKVLNRWKS